ncbi:hypothetical protein [Parachitinimonas caeni]|uniref:Uncharacterized protein n=1 Tax=Parachitinimonas caeni TaxID=3031301 RepID=A0ABT7E2R8_9NEIS|nr:hypothetical protein [Parachitinimonas caeni]MDK2126621.1 hypothetical protein [Parachitinimonas caeni]
MPIIDVELVVPEPYEIEPTLASALADALGKVFGSAPGRTWVKVRYLQASCYAENETTVAMAELPVFVTILLAHPPSGDSLTTQMLAVTHCVANACRRRPEQVHVTYAPAGAGRQAFGGSMV